MKYLNNNFNRLHFFMPGFAPLTSRGSQQYRYHITLVRILGKEKNPNV